MSASTALHRGLNARVAGPKRSCSQMMCSMRFFPTPFCMNGANSPVHRRPQVAGGFERGAAPSVGTERPRVLSPPVEPGRLPATPGAPRLSPGEVPPRPLPLIRQHQFEPGRSPQRDVCRHFVRVRVDVGIERRPVAGLVLLNHL